MGYWVSKQDLQLESMEKMAGEGGMGNTNQEKFQELKALITDRTHGVATTVDGNISTSIHIIVKSYTYGGKKILLAFRETKQ